MSIHRSLVLSPRKVSKSITNMCSPHKSPVKVLKLGKYKSISPSKSLLTKSTKNANKYKSKSPTRLLFHSQLHRYQRSKFVTPPKNRTVLSSIQSTTDRYILSFMQYFLQDNMNYKHKTKIHCQPSIACNT